MDRFAQHWIPHRHKFAAGAHGGPDLRRSASVLYGSLLEQREYTGGTAGRRLKMSHLVVTEDREFQFGTHNRAPLSIHYQLNGNGRRRRPRATASAHIPPGSSLPAPANDSADAHAAGAKQRHSRARCRSCRNHHDPAWVRRKDRHKSSIRSPCPSSVLSRA